MIPLRAALVLALLGAVLVSALTPEASGTKSVPTQTRSSQDSTMTAPSGFWTTVRIDKDLYGRADLASSQYYMTGSDFTTKASCGSETTAKATSEANSHWDQYDGPPATLDELLLRLAHFNCIHLEAHQLIVVTLFLGITALVCLIHRRNPTWATLVAVAGSMAILEYARNRKMLPNFVVLGIYLTSLVVGMAQLHQWYGAEFALAATALRPLIEATAHLIAACALYIIDKLSSLMQLIIDWLTICLRHIWNVLVSRYNRTGNTEVADETSEDASQGYSPAAVAAEVFLLHAPGGTPRSDNTVDAPAQTNARRRARRSNANSEIVAQMGGIRPDDDGSIASRLHRSNRGRREHS